MTSDVPLYLYAVCQIPEQPLTLPLGIERETMLVAVEGMGAIAEPDIDLAALQADDQRLLTGVLTHDRVICDLFQQTVLLPLRFGTQLASAERLRDHLLENQHDYQRKLAAVAQKAEYQIKLVPLEIPLPPLPEGLRGRDYFLAKKERLKAQTEAQQQQQVELGRLIQRIQTAYPQSLQGEPQDGAARLYLLADKTASADLRQRAEAWQAETAHWRMTLSEALPPYHFV